MIQSGPSIGGVHGSQSNRIIPLNTYDNLQIVILIYFDLSFKCFDLKTNILKKQ